MGEQLHCVVRGIASDIRDQHMHADRNSSAGTVPTFEDWLAEQGVILHNIRSGEVSDGARGVIARQSIPEGKRVTRTRMPHDLACANRSSAVSQS